MPSECAARSKFVDKYCTYIYVWVGVHNASDRRSSPRFMTAIIGRIASGRKTAPYSIGRAQSVTGAVAVRQRPRPKTAGLLWTLCCTRILKSSQHQHRRHHRSGSNAYTTNVLASLAYPSSRLALNAYYDETMDKGRLCGQQQQQQQNQHTLGCVRTSKPFRTHIHTQHTHAETATTSVVCGWCDAGVAAWNATHTTPSHKTRTTPNFPKTRMSAHIRETDNDNNTHTHTHKQKQRNCNDITFSSIRFFFCARCVKSLWI